MRFQMELAGSLSFGAAESILDRGLVDARFRGHDKPACPPQGSVSFRLLESRSIQTAMTPSGRPEISLITPIPTTNG